MTFASTYASRTLWTLGSQKRFELSGCDPRGPHARTAQTESTVDSICGLIA